MSFAVVARTQIPRTCYRFANRVQCHSYSGGIGHATTRFLEHRSTVIVATRKFTTSSPQWYSANKIESGDDKPRSRLVQLFQKSKALVVFYKDGLKQLWANHKQAKALKLRVQQEGHVLTRSEYQLIRRAEKDILKSIPFGLIFLILPESIPLFVIFAPGIVPSTCVTESQVQKQREKLDKARQIMSTNVLKASEQIPGISVNDFLSTHSFLKIAKHYNYDFELCRIRRGNLAAYCRFMGLRDWGTKGMLQRRLDKHMDYLLEDDKLIAKEGIQSLSLKELQQAVEERGMRSIGVQEDHLRRKLNSWITLHLNDQEISRGLLIFSRMFLLNVQYPEK